jgi:hypothetical protein
VDCPSFPPKWYLWVVLSTFKCTKMTPNAVKCIFGVHKTSIIPVELTNKISPPKKFPTEKNGKMVDPPL